MLTVPVAKAVVEAVVLVWAYDGRGRKTTVRKNAKTERRQNFADILTKRGHENALKNLVEAQEWALEVF
jgi:hypothetical protein